MSGARPDSTNTISTVLRREQRVLVVLLALVVVATFGTLVEVTRVPAAVVSIVAALAAVVALVRRRRLVDQAFDDLDEAISRREEAERAVRESEQRLRLAQEHSDIGFVMIGLDGRLQEVNPAFCRIVGHAESALLGTDVAELTHPDERRAGVSARAGLVAGDAEAIELGERLLHADGHEVWVQTDASLARDARGEPQYVMAMVQDISERVQAASEAAGYSAELERSNAELEQFAYVASHDLSEPLRVMSGFAELLRDDLGDDLGEEATRYVEFICDAAGRMQNLIDDLLAYSRVGRLHAPIAEVDLATVIEGVIGLVRDDVHDPATTFGVGELPVVRAAAPHVQHLFLNLVSNSVKFRSPDRPLRIELSAGPVTDALAIVYVDDNGIGIEERHRERVFRLFQRLHARSDFPGTGMGLAICRKIVDLYGGELTIEDSPIGGTRMVVALPLAVRENA